MQTLKRLLIEFRALKISLSLKFIIGVAVTLTLTMGVSLYFISKKHERLIIKQLDMQAKALFRQIVLTRRWIADHGGVFVMAPWKEPSQYLKESFIIDSEGNKYIKESPAMVTKELSKYAREEGTYWFHITSLKLINPENAPDDFEKTSLLAFENGNKEGFSRIEKTESGYYYRYMAPLYIEHSCLACHSHQDYEVGDVRGGISVAVPMDQSLSMMRSERKIMIMVSFATISILMLIMYIMMKELVLRPVKRLKDSMKGFSKGEKTETEITRTGDELEDLFRSFNVMSRSLTEYHDNLEDKVKKATRSFEDANKRLIELNERKSDFIAKISHELRTPMTSIKGAMDYISTRISRQSGTCTDAADLVEFLNVIKKNADRLIRLVNDTLDLERIESGVFDLHIGEVNLLSLTKEVVLSFQSIAGEKNISFRIYSDPEVLVLADEDRIRQVLINLISNAINYSPDNSEIEFRVNETDDSVTVSLKDTGPGIPEEVREKIFDKFYTIGNKQGTGLGLSICKGIIEAHGGKISVSGNDKEKGSIITFTLPKASEAGK